MSAGKVWLVGAGPGDPGLITVAALERLREADVIVYDRLVSPRLLEHAREGAELIFVGKVPAASTVGQGPSADRPHPVILSGDYARSGASVCREGIWGGASERSRRQLELP